MTSAGSNDSFLSDSLKWPRRELQPASVLLPALRVVRIGFGIWSDDCREDECGPAHLDDEG